jgi:photosystem II stability/assembly factor-like uncharacterized protein
VRLGGQCRFIERFGVHLLTRVATVCVLIALLPLTVAAAAAAYTYPRFQPVSIAFVDGQHGVLGEDDWLCQKAHGCRGRILITGDGGAHWRVSYVGTRGIHLYPVRGTRVVYAMTGTVMLRSADAGVHWQRLRWPLSVVSFVTQALGWRIEANAMLAHPPPLQETRDGGQTWTVRINPCRGDYGLTAAISFASAKYGWVVCNTQATAGEQGKEVLRTADGGRHWTLEGRTHPLAPPEPKLQLGNLPGYGYPIGATFLADGRGWLLQDRGYMLVTTDAGHTWRNSPITEPDTIAAQSADLLSEKLGFVLLRGCTVRLVRTTDAGKTWTTLNRWKSPTQC